MFYGTMRRMRKPKDKTPKKYIKDVGRKVITSEEEIMTKWRRDYRNEKGKEEKMKKLFRRKS